MNEAAGVAALPEVAKPNITRVWLPHSMFDHQAHRLLACSSCHTKALTSHETSDVLVPGIKTCQPCHRPAREGAAQSGCYECHAYHDWSKQKPVQGEFTTDELLGKTAGAVEALSP